MICIKTFVEIVDVVARARGPCALIAESEEIRRTIAQNVLRDFFIKVFGEKGLYNLEWEIVAEKAYSCALNARKNSFVCPLPLGEGWERV